jgi:hypothetical protein
VGHLLSSYQPHLRIYDYAQGGATVSGLSTQIRRKFLARHAKNVVWNAEDSLFVLWAGINDLAETGSPVGPIKALFQLMNELHGAGARNFLLLDCPPIHRTPGGKGFSRWKSLPECEDLRVLLPRFTLQSTLTLARIRIDSKIGTACYRCKPDSLSRSIKTTRVPSLMSVPLSVPPQVQQQHPAV